jgi:hypothetical protein
MKDQAVKEKFVELRALGWSFDRIAKELEVCKQTLITWSRDLILEIKNRRAIEHEALMEQHALTREGRIQLLGDLMKKLREELGSRSFSTVPTERLVDLALKVGVEWQGMFPELTLGVKEDPVETLNKSLKNSVAHWSV